MKFKKVFAASVCVFFLVFVILGVTEGKEDAFPAKPVTIICGYSAGGSTDIQIRTIAPYFQKYLGRPVVLENFVGAGSILACNKAFAAEPDGYTLLVSCLQQLITGEYFRDTIARYRTREMTFLYNLVRESPILVTHPDLYPSFKEFIEAAKTKRLKVGVSGKWEMTHLYVALLEHLSKVKFNVIPFEGGGPGMTSLMGKHIDALMTIGSTAYNMVRSGQIRPLLVEATSRTAQYPQVPVPADLGYDPKETQIVLYTTGIYGPPKMPPERAKILETALAKAVKDPEYMEKIKKMNIDLYPQSAEQFRRTYEQEYPVIIKFAEILKKAQ